MRRARIAAVAALAAAALAAGWYATGRDDSAPATAARVDTVAEAERASCEIGSKPLLDAVKLIEPRRSGAAERAARAQRFFADFDIRNLDAACTARVAIPAQDALRVAVQAAHAHGAERERLAALADAKLRAARAGIARIGAG